VEARGSADDGDDREERRVRPPTRPSGAGWQVAQSRVALRPRARAHEGLGRPVGREGRVAAGTLRWRAGPGGGERDRRIGRDGGWTAFVGPTLASPRGRIVAVMSPSNQPTCAWISWPLLVAVVGLDFSLIVFRIVSGDLIFELRVARIGRLRLEAEPRSPEGRLLPQISAGWDRIAAAQRRRLVCPLGAVVLACVGPLWPR